MPKVFLDSGAFSMAGKARKKSHLSEKKFYKTKEWWAYIDAYAKFIIKYKDSFDHYANVDTSRFPKITWDVQKYLEEKWGLNPLPVIHHGEPMKWFEKYLEAGYKYICIGGVAKTKGYSQTRRFNIWGDQIFKRVCPSPDYKPTIKLHGFAITSIPLMQRYPWYSVDSVTWKKMSYYGQILVPPLSKGEYNFRIPPMVVFIDPTSKYTQRDGNTGRHFLFYSKAQQEGIREWLKYIKVPFGKRKGDGSIIMGVSNEDHFRCQANIRYFELMAKSLPKWPWAFEPFEHTDFFGDVL
jgi:hypothetical protein